MGNYNSHKSKRLFIALRPHVSSNLVKVIHSLKKALPSTQMKWVPPENLHVTIKYLGNTPSFYLNAIEKAIIQSAQNAPPFKLSIKSLGLFGNNQRPKVLWAGIENNKSLNTLYESTENLMVQLGYEPENRPYSPHVTLARFKGNINQSLVENEIKRYSNVFIQESEIQEIVLFESISTNSGPVYKALKTVSLNSLSL